MVSAAIPFQKQRARVLGRTMAYVEVGRGDPIVLEKFGGLDSLVYKDIPEPEPKAGHVVIQVNLCRLLEEKRT